MLVTFVLSIFLILIPVIHGGFLGDSLKFIKEKSICHFTECCEDVHVKNGVPDFRDVFGQQLAVDGIQRALTAFYKTPNSKKPLVLSLHGTPGIGKNFMADQIIRARYAKGIDSRYVHGYSGRASFPLDEKAASYGSELLLQIQGFVNECPYQTFVFDEIDKMPVGVLETIVPQLDHNSFLSKHDWSKSLFIFLSNTGGVEIANKLSLLMRKEGLTREDSRLHHFERIIEESAYNGNGALQKSRSIEKAVIDFHIPFLPLEQRHVEMCIRKYIAQFSNSPRPDLVVEILKSVPFEDDTHMFASSGCKKLEARVAAAMHTEL